MTTFPIYQPPAAPRPEPAPAPAYGAVPADPYAGGPYAAGAPYAAQPGWQSQPVVVSAHQYRRQLRAQRRAGRRAEAIARTGGESPLPAALAHFSFFFAWIFGSLICYHVAQPGSYLRRQAARAFNWQLTATVIGIVSGIVANSILHLHTLDHLVTLAVVGLTIVGGLKALQGRDWRNPVSERLNIQVLKEDA